MANIILPPSVFRSDLPPANRMHLDVKWPWARDYMPGGSKYQRDSEFNVRLRAELPNYEFTAAAVPWNMIGGRGDIPCITIWQMTSTPGYWNFICYPRDDKRIPVPYMTSQFIEDLARMDNTKYDVRQRIRDEAAHQAMLEQASHAEIEKHIHDVSEAISKNPIQTGPAAFSFVPKSETAERYMAASGGAPEYVPPVNMEEIKPTPKKRTPKKEKPQ